MSDATRLKVAPNEALDEVLKLIRNELQAIDLLLNQEVASLLPEVADIAQHVLLAGGKRLRPTALALSALSVGKDYPFKQVVHCSAAMELLHTATLIHDDVIDETSSRRGKPTANKLFGNSASVLSGDALLAKAMLLVIDGGDRNLMNVITNAVIAMSEGAVQEIMHRGSVNLSEEHYFEVVKRKTASFVSACCCAGALIAGADEATAECLSSYGFHVGIAFQVVDDLLDYLGDPSKTGKSIGTDFIEGNATLPLIYLMKNGHSDKAKRLFSGRERPEALTELALLIQTSGSADYSMDIAAQHIITATNKLKMLPESPACEGLKSIAQFTISREI
ncbi:MAG: polyprenyl synthetase family protein [bacterium]